MLIRVIYHNRVKSVVFDVFRLQFPRFELFYSFVILGIEKKFSTTMQSCRFFSQPFNENFKFLKNCPYDFHKILHSHSTPKRAPARAKASKSYDWDVRNMVKISPKMAENSHFSTFFDFLKNSIQFKRNFLAILHRHMVLCVQFL